MVARKDKIWKGNILKKDIQKKEEEVNGLEKNIFLHIYDQNWVLKFTFNEAKGRYGVNLDFKPAQHQACYQRPHLDHCKLASYNQIKLIKPC